MTIYCKDETGTIIPWPHTQDAVFRPWRHVQYNEGESPLSRISELFNVNHFIVSQARPYLVPFLRSELNLLDRRQTGWNNLSRSAMRLIIVELRHRLRQLDYLGLLPAPPVSYTHLRAHETDSYLVCRLLLEKKKYAVFCLKKKNSFFFFFFLMIRRQPRSTHCISSAASDVYKRQGLRCPCL